MLDVIIIAGAIAAAAGIIIFRIRSGKKGCCGCGKDCGRCEKK